MLELKPRGGWYHVSGNTSRGGKLHRRATGVRVGGRENYAKAKQRLREIEDEILREERAALEQATGVPQPAPEVSAYPTLTEWVAFYKDKYQHTTKKGVPMSPRTLKTENGNLVHALALFGERRLDTFVPVEDQNLYLKTRRGALHRQSKTKEISESTIVREVSVLTKVWGYAKAKYTELAAGVFKNLTYDMPVRHRIVTDEEAAIFLPRLVHGLRRLYRFYRYTGCRLEGAMSIDPAKHIDWEHHFVSVWEKGCKREEDRRRVPMYPIVETLLREELAENPRLWMDLKPKRVSKQFAQACKGRKRAWRGEEPRPAIVPNITPHVLRHTFGWAWLTGRNPGGRVGDIYKLSKILGHKSVEVTQKHYAYLGDHDLAEAMFGDDHKNISTGSHRGPETPPVQGL